MPWIRSLVNKKNITKNKIYMANDLYILNDIEGKAIWCDDDFEVLSEWIWVVALYGQAANIHEGGVYKGKLIWNLATGPRIEIDNGYSEKKYRIYGVYQFRPLYNYVDDIVVGIKTLNGDTVWTQVKSWNNDSLILENGKNYLINNGVDLWVANHEIKLRPLIRWQGKNGKLEKGKVYEIAWHNVDYYVTVNEEIRANWYDCERI